MKWAWIAFFTAVILTAFFVPRAHSHELPCFDKTRAEMFEPRESLRGYGTTEEGLVKLSVSSSGAWMLTCMCMGVCLRLACVCARTHGVRARVHVRFRYTC